VRAAQIGANPRRPWLMIDHSSRFPRPALAGGAASLNRLC
jgi:hypothetical protein